MDERVPFMADYQINLRKISPQPEAIRLIPEDMARKYSAVPLAVNGNTLTVAMSNLSDIFALEALATHSHMRIEPVISTAEENTGMYRLSTINHMKRLRRKSQHPDQPGC